MKMKKIINQNKNKIILFIAFCIGSISLIFFGDKKLDNEWLNLVQNLENYNILSSRNINGEWIPNLLMPPLYPIFLFLIKKIFFFAENFYINIILIIQLVLFVISSLFLKKILNEIFNDDKISDLGTLVFLIYPLNVYAISQISSITLQVFFFTIFLYNFVIYYKYEKIFNLFVYAAVSGFLILLRGEFFVFFFFSLFFLFVKKKRFYIIIASILVSLIIISPYLIRNYNIFSTLALTKSTGFNLLKGNNPKSKVEGIAMWTGYDVVPELEEDLKKIKPLSKYDLISDKIFLNKAFYFIKENPLKYLILYIKKFLSFLFIDMNSSYPGYYSFLNILPKILISLTTIIAMFSFISFKINLFNYFTLLYFLHAFIFSFFFILPRYSLSVLPIQIILSLFLYEKYLSYIKKK